MASGCFCDLHSYSCHTPPCRIYPYAPFCQPLCVHKPWLCHPSPVGGGTSPPGESPVLETDIKKIIVTEPSIQQQGCQETSTNSPLVQLSTKQFCQQVGDQTCIAADRNFKILFVHTAQNMSGDWVSNGVFQNISPDSLEQVIAILHLYDCSGRVVWYAEGFTIPYNLSSMQTTIFNQTISPTNLTGTPKFFRVSFDSGSVSNSTGYNSVPPVSNSTVMTANNVTANNIGTLNNEENALEHLENYTGAMAMADKVLAIDPNNVYALKSKGVVLNYLRLGHYLCLYS